MVWKKLGSTTLSSSAQNITYNIDSSKFISFMIHGIPDSTVHASFQFNSDTGQSYNNNYSTNGGTNYTDLTQTKLRISPDGHTLPEFFIAEMANFSGEEKLVISHCVYQNTAGAGTAPARLEMVGKWTGTAEVSTIKFYENDQSGVYNTGTNITTLGSDGAVTPAPNNVQDNSIFVEKDTANRFWFSEALAPTLEDNFSSSSAWTITGTEVVIDGSDSNKVVVTGTSANGNTEYAYSPLGSTLTTGGLLNFKFKLISAPAPDAINYEPIFLHNKLSGNPHTTSTGFESMGVGINSKLQTMYPMYKDTGDNGWRSDISGAVTLSINTDYWVSVSLASDGVTQSLKIYTNEARTTQHGSTQTTTIPIALTDLKSVIISTTDFASGAGYNASYEIDDLKIYDGVTTPTPATWKNEDQTRGVFAGGGAGNVIDYIIISTLGNATDFGDLTVVKNNVAGVSNNTRGVFGGGEITGVESNIMDYITIATTGNATDFGDLTVARRGIAGVSSSVRGVFAGGYDGSGYSNVMDYITIATTGNATDFGNLTASNNSPTGLNSDTRGVFGGGDQSATVTNVIQYITIDTTGNATDFGDLTVAREACGGVANGTRGVFAGGNTGSVSNVIDYITIATTGNASDFGDLTVARRGTTGVSSATRGVFGGGKDSSNKNFIDYITIATTGNTTDFGDLTVARSGAGGVSGE